MKEHIIFATVFFILAAGYFSFSTTGVTGKVFDDNRQFTGAYGSRYDGPVSTDPYADFDSLVLVGSVSRKYRLIDPTDYNLEIDRKTLRICLGHLREAGVDSIMGAEKALRPIGLASQCLPAERLDVNNDEKLNFGDDQYYGMLTYGLVTKATAGLTSNELPCTELGKVQFITGHGGYHICRERPEDASHPFKSSAHTRLVWDRI
jgi:hypothetical protein